MTTLEDTPAPDRAPASRDQTAALERLIKPKTIAIVGLSDANPMQNYIRPTLDSGAEVMFVNPKYDTVMGRSTFPTISDIEQPIDAVMCFMAAERTTLLAEECAGLDIGGLVLIAGGFAETGSAGAELQGRLVAAAERGGFSVIGPNGLGYVNVRHGISLTIASQHKRRPGGISVVSQSGAMLSGVAMAAWEHPGLGLNVIVSAGNEAVTDLADYVNYLVDDQETTAIGLVVETVRRPDVFFAAVQRAAEAGKPVVALKLARSSRTRQMAASHTGALTGDAWVYDVAFAQAGIAMARDPEELVDRLSMVAQLDRGRWTDVSRLGVVTMTGGFASLSFDIAAEEGLDLPALESLKPWVVENLPGVTVPNPLDTTGLGGKFWPQIVESYATSDELDALMFIHPLAEEDNSANSLHLVEELQRVAQKVSKPIVVANCSGAPGAFVCDAIGGSGVMAIGHGLRSSLRGLATLGWFNRIRGNTSVPGGVTAVPAPAVVPIRVEEGPMLPFAATMDLLTSYGIPTAPYHLIDAGTSVTTPPFDGPYVVKLADVAHRTEHGAVKLNVISATLPDAVDELRRIAASEGLPSVVAVQPMVHVQGEAIVGIKGHSELGPMVVFGMGGILVEVIRRVGGRMAPIDRKQAASLIAEFDDLGLMHGFRGSPPWDLDALAELLVNVGRLATEAAGWLDTLDVNPLVFGCDGFVAVDGLCLLQET